MKASTTFALWGALAFGLSTPILGQEADIGATLYGDFCAACHGASGKGDGDMANVMTIPAPNLTLLAKGNEGVFPLLKVIHIIDGETGMRGHGRPMPRFGRVFKGDREGAMPEYGGVLEARGRVLSLARYLESIQE